MNSIREILKNETRLLHNQIESQIDFKSVCDLSSYVKMLQKFLGFYLPYEERVSRSANRPSQLKWNQRKKTGWLIQDLEFLKAPLDILQSDDLPSVISEAELLGSLYVIEGSTLGGQLLSRHFNESLGVTSESGLAFFSGYKNETGMMWREFIAVLESRIVTEEDKQMSLAAAKSTFTKLGGWFEK